MPKKLVLDRLIFIKLAYNQEVSVPENEFWKVQNFNSVEISGISLSTYVESKQILISGGSMATIKASGSNPDRPTVISGLAFKLEEV